VALALALVAATGCAESIGDVDRTQPNYLRKSDLDGEWYYLQTVVDVPPTSIFTFIGETSRTEKLRWSIQEDYLVGYRSYPLIPGADAPATRGPDLYGEGYTENPVVAFEVDSHFDRIREYNSATGEQSNVLIEDDTDRPWFERDFLRVDWSKNLVTNFDFVSEASEVTNLDYFVQEEQGGEDALYREEDSQGRTHYFDLTGKMFVEPDLYGCWYTWMGWAAEDCTAGEIKVRFSFSRAPEEPEYAPFQYDDNLMSKYGYFRSERVSYDARRGQTDDGRRYAMNRHDIWAQTWQRDPETGEVRKDDQGRRLPIPISERETAATPYYLSPAFPADPLLLWAAFDTMQQWDDAARRGVAALQGRPIDEVGTVFVACHNPVRPGDHPACGAPGFVARFGDLRHSTLHWVDPDQLEGPLGYGPSVVDPVTGETISGKAHVYGAAVDTYTSYAMDVIRLINEDVPAQDLATGEHFRRDVLDRLHGSIDPEQLHQGLDSVPVRTSEEALSDGRRLAPAEHPEAHRRYERLSRRKHRRAEGFTPWSADAAQRGWERVVDSGLGQRFVNDEVRSMVAGRLQRTQGGPVGLDDVPDALADAAARQLSPFALKQRKRFRRRALERNIALSDFLETSAAGLARTFEGRTDYDRMWRELRAMVFQATAIHEVGHTVGLRHNFQASYDALNYFDGYWDLRAETLPDPGCNCFSKCKGVRCGDGELCNALSGECIGEPGRRCEGVRCPEGQACDGHTGRCVVTRAERLSHGDLYRMAALTESQVEGRMRDHQYSSIMDYGYSFQSDLMGLGKYDAAAIAFGYGCGHDRVEVDDPRCDDPGSLRDAEGGCLVARPGPVEVFAKPQGELGRAGELLSGTETHFGHAVRYDDTNIPNVSVLERYHYTTLMNAFPSSADLHERSWMRYDEFLAAVGDRKAPASERPVRVPYAFCSDEWVEEMLSCQLFDQGADPFEMTMTKANHWRSFYYFDNFRRNRFGWEAYNVLFRSFARYFLPISDYHQFWWFADDGYDPVFDAYFEMAAYTGFNVLAEVLAVPPYGTYCRSRADGSLIPLSDDATRQDRRDEEEQVPSRLKAYCTPDRGLVEVRPGDGRRRLSRFAFDTGYYSYDRTQEAGHWWSTMAAVWALTDPDASVIGVDAEAGTYSISFYDLFDEEFAKLAAGIVMEDHALYAPGYVVTGDADRDGVPDGEVVYRTAAGMWAQDATGSWHKVDPETGRALDREPGASRTLCQACGGHSDCLGYTGYWGGVFCGEVQGARRVCLQDCEAWERCGATCRAFDLCQRRCERWAERCLEDGDCGGPPEGCDAKGACHPDRDPGTCDGAGACDARLDPCGDGTSCSDGFCVPQRGCPVEECDAKHPDGGCPEGEMCREGVCHPVAVTAQTDPTLMLVDDMLMWGLYDLRGGYELRFNDGFKVFRMGTDEEERPDGEDFEVQTFTDPVGGHQYGALVPRCEAIAPGEGTAGVCSPCRDNADCAGYTGNFYGSVFCDDVLGDELCLLNCGNGLDDLCPPGTECRSYGEYDDYCVPVDGPCVSGACSADHPRGDCEPGTVCVDGLCQGAFEPNARCRHLRPEPTPAERMVQRGQELSKAYLDAMDAYYGYEGDDEALDEQLRWDFYGARWKLDGFLTNLNLLRTYQDYFDFLF